MILQFKGELEIEEGLTLLDPKMELMRVHYDLKTNEFKLEVYFWETKFIHSRSYTAVNEFPGSLDLAYVLKFVNEHTILSKFKPQV